MRGRRCEVFEHRPSELLGAFHLKQQHAAVEQLPVAGCENAAELPRLRGGGAAVARGVWCEQHLESIPAQLQIVPLE